MCQLFAVVLYGLLRIFSARPCVLKGGMNRIANLMLAAIAALTTLANRVLNLTQENSGLRQRITELESGNPNPNPELSPEVLAAANELESWLVSHEFATEPVPGEQPPLVVEVETLEIQTETSGSGSQSQSESDAPFQR